MYFDRFTDFNFEITPGSPVGPKESTTNRVNEKRAKQLELLAPFILENQLHRKPCPTCGNLVRPELQLQHNDAYHPNNMDIPHTPETDHDDD